MHTIFVMLTTALSAEALTNEESHVTDYMIVASNLLVFLVTALLIWHEVKESHKTANHAIDENSEVSENAIRAIASAVVATENGKHRGANSTSAEQQ